MVSTKAPTFKTAPVVTTFGCAASAASAAAQPHAFRLTDYEGRSGRVGSVAAADPRIAPPSRYAHCRAPLLTAMSPPAVSLARKIVTTIQPARTSQAAAREDDPNATPRIDAIKTPRTMSTPQGMTRYRSEKIRIDRCA